MGAVSECQQCGGGVLSADNNFAKEGEEVGLVEMNDDVVAPSARASSHVNSFLIKRKQANKQTNETKIVLLIFIDRLYTFPRVGPLS